MNRLWVRFSLIIIFLVLLVAVIPSLIFWLIAQFELSAVVTPAEMRVELGVNISESDLMTLRTFMLEQMFNNLLSGTLISIVAGVAGGIWISRIIARPLTQLEDGARTLARRQLNHRVPVAGSDELQSVAQAFNQMADELEQAETLRSNMLADIAHELRHPLQILQGNLQAILDEIYELDMEEIARLYGQTEQLTRLVNDLHELAQAEAMRLPLHKQSADVKKIVEDVMMAWEPVALGANVRLAADLPTRSITATIDAARIQQTVSNLVRNAIQHTPADGSVLLSLREDAQGVQILVDDTGIGIAAEHIPHVFDRFYRADPSRKRGDGTGLGLAIAQAIVKAHGGVISAESAGANLGSSFAIHLPT